MRAYFLFQINTNNIISVQRPEKTLASANLYGNQGFILPSQDTSFYITPLHTPNTLIVARVTRTPIPYYREQVIHGIIAHKQTNRRYLYG